MPLYTFDVNTKGIMHLCEIVKTMDPQPIIFHASTSEMFGPNSQNLLNETSEFNPASPYAVSKVSAYFIAKYYQKVFNLKICTSIGFNHESPLRHEEFITRKISKGVARIKHGDNRPI